MFFDKKIKIIEDKYPVNFNKLKACTFGIKK